MNIYIITIFIVSVLSLLFDTVNIDLITTSNKNTIKLFSMFLITIITFILIFVAGLRYEVGTDYWQYRINYSGYVTNVWESIITFNEPGIRIISYVSSLINDHYGMMFLISSIITVGLSVYTIFKSSNLLFFSILLYIFVGSWHGSFNGVRQYLAGAILFYGHKYILGKNPLKYIVTVIIASAFHISALPMILLYFIPQRKLRIRELLLTIIVTVIGFFSYDLIVAAITFIENLRGDNFYVTDYVTRQISILRVVIAIAPIILYVIVPKIKEYSNTNYFYINMLIVNAMFYIISYNSAYLNRFTIYTNLFTAIGIPVILKGTSKETKYISVPIILILYFLFWYTEVSSTPNLYNFNWIFNY